jgi:threonine dehydrogenase-like Zn-dependent dehydrogenase
MYARIAEFGGLNRMVIGERPMREPGRGEVLVRLTEAAVCGSEVDVMFDAGFWEDVARGVAEVPPAGHEATGFVEAVGEGVTGLTVGDKVVPWCERGFATQGPDTRPNGFATHAVFDADVCVKVRPENRWAVAMEPVGCCVRSVMSTEPTLGDHVVIVGTGFLARVLVLLSWMSGAASVTVVGRRREPLAHVKELDARTNVVNSSEEDVRDAVRDIVGSAGADVVYECTGVQAGIDLAQPLVRGGTWSEQGGKFTLVGFHRFGRRSLDLAQIGGGAITMPLAHTRDQHLAVEAIGRAVRLVEAGRLDLSSFEFPQFEFDQIDDAFRAAHHRDSSRFGRAVIII